MAPLPKRKISKARQGERRSHLALEPIQLSACPQCKEPKPSHVVCPKCGYYDGKEVIKPKVKKEKKSQ